MFVDDDYDDYNESDIISPILNNFTNYLSENLDENDIPYEITAPATAQRNNLYYKTDNFPNKRKIIKGFLQNKRENKKKKKGRHTMDSPDNKRRKLIGKFIKILVDFFKSKFKISDEAKQIKEIRFSKTFFKIDNIKNSLEEKLKNILSVDIKKKYKKYKKEHNNELIKEYEEGNDEQIKSFLNCRLINWIKYFRKDDDIINNNNFSFLKGLEEYYDEFVKFKEEIRNDSDKKYIESLINLINNLENELGKNPIKENYEMDN